jgi:hypothetical protein
MLFVDNARRLFSTSRDVKVSMQPERKLLWSLRCLQRMVFPLSTCLRGVAFKVQVPISGFWGDFTTSRLSASMLINSTCTLFRVACPPTKPSIGGRTAPLGARGCQASFFSFFSRFGSFLCIFMVGSVVLLTSCDGCL